MPQEHVLMGVVYNRNGIATWSIEAARALLGSGAKVTLVTTSLEWLPNDLHPYSFCIGVSSNRNVWQKIRGRLHWWMQFFIASPFNQKPFRQAYEQLEKDKCKPTLILVAQTDFLWPGSPVPQWVVARSWPISLTGYLGKMKLLKSQPWLPRLHDLVFWYRMDHKAYAAATGVLTLTRRLAEDLAAQGYTAKKLFPCMGLPPKNGWVNRPVIPRLLSAAHDLGDKLKNMEWLMDCMGQLYTGGTPFELTLVGKLDGRLEKQFRAMVPHVRFTGPLSRQALLQEMAVQDIFLFASLKENWGYVISEAMAMGMAPVIPDIYPFDEIWPNPSLRFAPGDKGGLIGKIEALIGNPALLYSEKQRAFQWYQQSFSPGQFSSAFFEAVNP